ncbi:MAG: hypothetical protein HLUCCO07_02765 [Rhodobacteraceae bacterium HLUCCO07]|nr:MAG: hypothetical protein HLUCCO07_02765 [Rhodobacteraceae bacterium HLUCCO07]
MPGWVPEAARHYLVHTECGLSIRAIARSVSRHPSTVLRQVRRWEILRDDILIDEALIRLARLVPREARRREVKEPSDMTLQERPIAASPDDDTFEIEARRVLRRLCESGAVLAVAPEMDKAVVVRDTTGGGTTRTAVVERAMAQALAVKDWIACVEPGRIARYRITQAGRTALGRMLAAQENAAQGAAQGFAEAQSGFDRPGLTPAGQGAERKAPRFAPGDSPMAALARRRDRDGVPFLAADLVAAGERLREDFELAQMGPRVRGNWDHVLTGAINGGRPAAGADAMGGSSAARARVEAALRELGPGLGDVALRCCCHLEGLEQAEKALGWSARSGKIVLRIALQRLKRHYAGLGDAAGMIG